MTRRWIAIALGITVVISIGLPVTAASWNLSASDSVGTPPETFSVEGNQFRVSTISRVSDGRLRVNVNTDSDERYQINLYDNQKNVIDFRSASGSSTALFSTDGLSPGTYVVAAVEDGPKAIQPVVVSGVDVDVDAPDEIHEGQAYEVTAEITQTGPVSVTKVQVLIWGYDFRKRVSLSSEGGNTFSGRVSGLSQGSYRVQVGVRGADRIEGRNELVGLSSGDSVSVNEGTPTPTTTREPTPTPTPTTTTMPTPTTPPPTTPGSTTTAPSPTTRGSTESTSSPTSARSPTPGSEGSPTSPTSPSPTSATTSGNPSTASPTTSADGPITPNETSATGTTAGSGPGLGVTAFLLAFLGSALFLVGRRR